MPGSAARFEKVEMVGSQTRALTLALGLGGLAGLCAGLPLLADAQALPTGPIGKTLLEPVTGEDAGPRTPPMVASARELLGVPYHFGGRLRPGREGIDCQGVLFYAAERVSNCGWRSFSVFPTRALASSELGDRVPGLDPIATSSVRLAKLRAGDVLLFVGPSKNPVEPAIGSLEGQPVWVWHTGLYSGDGHFIVGDHYAGEAVETPLLPYLKAHADAYSGLFVTRMTEGPRPRRCRKHPKMKRSTEEGGP